MEYLIVWGLWITFIISMNTKEFTTNNVDPIRALMVLVVFAVPIELIYIGTREIVRWLGYV